MKKCERNQRNPRLQKIALYPYDNVVDSCGSCLIPLPTLFTFQKQVLRCLAAWMDWAVYTPDFLFDLENVFLGNTEKSSQPEVRKVAISLRKQELSLPCMTPFQRDFHQDLVNSVLRG